MTTTGRVSLSVGFSINKGGMKTKDKKNKFIELIVQGNDLTINLSFLKNFFVLSNKIYSTVTECFYPNLYLTFINYRIS